MAYSRPSAYEKECILFVSVAAPFDYGASFFPVEEGLLAGSVVNGMSVSGDGHDLVLDVIFNELQTLSTGRIICIN